MKMPESLDLVIFERQTDDMQTDDGQMDTTDHFTPSLVHVRRVINTKK